MKTKNVTLVIASVFALIFMLAFASATLIIGNVVVPTSANDASGSFQVTFDLTNNGCWVFLKKDVGSFKDMVSKWI